MICSSSMVQSCFYCKPNSGVFGTPEIPLNWPPDCWPECKHAEMKVWLEITGKDHEIFVPLVFSCTEEMGPKAIVVYKCLISEQSGQSNIFLLAKIVVKLFFAITYLRSTCITFYLINSGLILTFLCTVNFGLLQIIIGIYL